MFFRHSFPRVSNFPLLVFCPDAGVGAVQDGTVGLVAKRVRPRDFGLSLCVPLACSRICAHGCGDELLLSRRYDAAIQGGRSEEATLHGFPSVHVAMTWALMLSITHAGLVSHVQTALSTE